jgi:hypothetical protein
MEINYDLILKYLQPKNKILNNNIKIDDINNNIILENNDNKEFITQKNIFNYSKSFPEFFKNFLSDKFYRYGITIYDNDNCNISFWTSLLTLIDKKFIIPYNHNEISIINEFKFQLIEKYKKNIISNFLKQFDKNNIRERMKLEPDIYILQYICDILDITFLIFDFKNNTIYSIYSGLLLNPFKQIFIFAKCNSFWEPIMSIKSKGNTKRIFDINDINIKKILYSNNICYYENIKINKEFNILLIKDIIDKEKNNNNLCITLENEDEEEKNEEENKEEENKEEENEEKTINEEANKKKINNIFIDLKSININDFNKSKLTKMKMEQIYNICNILKIEYNKKTIKLDLINKILDKK